ncbi:hypothetical protein CFIO01_05912 [Colletotrichum fioriniae PJ7]|uniref:DUF6604 domain-containing protein n=1 Tax=Colletotrichum fioriniae PJ7 TaxID=1445577 RepID=A0A010R0C1_9PEZI|nr:hypothetical protein CFIO01_05912 [Colletotrichum fioriniae PJ7]
MATPFLPDNSGTTVMMASRQSYLGYKRDTNLLLSWMRNKTNNVINSSEAFTQEIYKSTHFRVKDLSSMATIIVAGQVKVPSKVFYWLRSVIRARIAHYDSWVSIVSMNPDARIEASNSNHRYFIDTLVSVFITLGGGAWLSRPGATPENSPGKPVKGPGAQATQFKKVAEAVEDFIFYNMFSALDLGEDEQTSEPESESGNESQSVIQNKKKRFNRGKKNQKGKARSKGSKKTHTSGSDKEAPLDSYRILEADEDLMDEYSMAASAFRSEWCDMRTYLQDIWEDVAYHDLNSAVAGAVSKVAIAKVRKTELAIFVDFPGNDCYHNIIQAFDRSISKQTSGSDTVADIHDNVDMGQNGDIREQLLLHTYQDLLDFVRDFQKNRTGKPTKAMQAKIKNWDVNFSVESATPEERISWRRSFTMNWLFDLVNVFSLPIIKSLRDSDKLTSLEDIDWNTSHGQQSDIRGLFGLEDFACFVTTLAMQKPSTDITSKILPHHVFQLQCIVDATTIWRGWTFDEHGSHQVKSPAASFVPTVQVNFFIGRDGANQDTGYCPVLSTLCEDTFAEPKPEYALFRNCKSLWELGDDFIHLLGVSRMAEGAKDRHEVASRFSHVNSNGLWDYSPYLCGVGLVEGLQLAYSTSMAAWNRIHEPFTFVHLHNMLKERGYLERSTYVNRIAGFFRAFFKDSIFDKGEIPKSKFAKGYQDVFNRTMQNKSKNKTDGYDGGDLDSLERFHAKSQLVLYQEADWDPSRIPDRVLDPRSALGIVRLNQARRFNPATGKFQFEETELVRTALKKGMGDDWLGVSTTLEEAMKTANRCRFLFPPKALAIEEEEEDDSTDWNNLRIFLEDLEAAKIDFCNDIIGCRPFSGINYTEIAWTLMRMFKDIEDELDERVGPNWRCSGCLYDTEEDKAGHNRLHLARSVMNSAQDDLNEERLSIFAKHFDEHFSILTEYMYFAKFQNPLQILADRSGKSLPADLEGEAELPLHMESIYDIRVI